MAQRGSRQCSCSQFPTCLERSPPPPRASSLLKTGKAKSLQQIGMRLGSEYCPAAAPAPSSPPASASPPPVQMLREQQLSRLASEQLHPVSGGRGPPGAGQLLQDGGGTLRPAGTPLQHLQGGGECRSRGAWKGRAGGQGGGDHTYSDHKTAVGLQRSTQSLGAAAAPGIFGDIMACPWVI